jgi:heme A synthase
VVAVPSLAFRRLVLATAVATFVLIIVGGVVRVSDSGLGCGPGGSGLHGWPFCKGNVVPGVDLNSVVEYTHRALAGAVSIMIVALVVLSWRRYRQWFGVTLALLVLILAQAGLGGATVEDNLNESYVAAHLGLAMLLLGGLVYLARGVYGVGQSSGGPRMRALAVGASVAVFCTIVAGGYMAGTQKYGRPDYQLGDGAHHACGTQFPGCNGGFMPFGESRLVNIHLTHRAFMYLASVLLITLIVIALRRRIAVGYAYGLAALLCAQIFVGALNVWLTNEYEWLILVHLALGTLLWATTLGMTLQLAPARSRAPSRTEAVAA